MVKRHIYIFRHGQSTYNRDHKFTGWIDARLTKRGIADARKIARKLKDKKFQVAYHSSLTRSKDTLKQVLKYHPECTNIIMDNRIIERNYGDVSGKTHEWFVEESGEEDYKTLLHWHKIDHLNGREREQFVKEVGEAELQIVRRSYSIPPPGGESVKDVEKRVNSFIRDLINMIKKEKVNVAISAHGNSMRPFRKHFEKLTTEQMMKLENPWDDYFDYAVDV